MELMNDAPLDQKVEGMQKFYNEIVCELEINLYSFNNYF